MFDLNDCMFVCPFQKMKNVRSVHSDLPIGGHMTDLNAVFQPRNLDISHTIRYAPVELFIGVTSGITYTRNYQRHIFDIILNRSTYRHEYTTFTSLNQNNDPFSKIDCSEIPHTSVCLNWL